MRRTKYGTCRLCESHRPLVRSHLVPNSFYREALSGGNRLHRIESDNPARYRIVQSGEYDGEILCSTCEASFSGCDAYAERLLLRSELRQSAESSTAVVLDNFDFRLLRRFVVATVWRITVSSRPFGDQIRVSGDKQARMAAFLRGDSHQQDSDFAVLWSILRRSTRWPEIDPSRIITSPHLWHSDGCQFVRLNLGAIVAILHVDETPLSPLMSRMRMSPGRAVFVARPFDGSPELGFTKTVINSP